MLGAESALEKGVTASKTARWLGVIVAGIAAVVLAGWALDVPALRSALPFGVAMRANAALALILSAVAALTGSGTLTASILGKLEAVADLAGSGDLAGALGALADMEARAAAIHAGEAGEQPTHGGAAPVELAEVVDEGQRHVDDVEGEDLDAGVADAKLGARPDPRLTHPATAEEHAAGVIARTLSRVIEVA